MRLPVFGNVSLRMLFHLHLVRRIALSTFARGIIGITQRVLRGFGDCSTRQLRDRILTFMTQITQATFVRLMVE